MGTDISIVDRLNDTGIPQYRFSRNGETSRQSELIIHVCRRGGNSWYGVFPSGNHPEIATSGFHHWSSSDKLLVVSKGRGYIVDTNNPSVWSEAHLSPITWYDNSSIEDTVIVCDFRRIAAYSALGLMWKTPQLSWGGIRNIEVSEESIRGEAWDAPWDSWVSFLVDTQSGKHQGGATISLV